MSRDDEEIECWEIDIQLNEVSFDSVCSLNRRKVVQ